MRHGGFDARATSSTETDVALLAGAAKAKVAMAGGPPKRCPLAGASRVPPVQEWSRGHADVADVCQYAAADVDRPESFIRQRLPAAQGEISRTVADEDGQRFLPVTTSPREQA